MSRPEAFSGRLTPLWQDGADLELPGLGSLPGDFETDIAIVGAGFTGLWTALYVRERMPDARIGVIEAKFPGFGASGRNGGWCSSIFPVGLDRLASEHGTAAALRLLDVLRETIDEVGARCETSDFVKGGEIALIRNRAQHDRAVDSLRQARGFGIDETRLRMLDTSETAEIVRSEGVLGSLFTPDCAVLHPGKLVAELCRRVVSTGSAIWTDTRVEQIEPGRVLTARGTVKAEVVVRATEAFSLLMPGHRRDLAPIYSLMIATEPLAPEVWQEIGLDERQALTDGRNMTIYCQRTADSRLALGGRGAAYRFGSTISPEFESDPSIHAGLEALIGELFPAARGCRVTHRWGGAIGVARDWHPSVAYDRDRGLAWAGGYAGDGVAISNMAGRTLADLISGTDSALTALPWVNRPLRRWEPEPLRWLGVNAGLALTDSSDRSEKKTGRPARRWKLLSRYLGL